MTTNRSGFTLIELLIVVAIVGILAAILSGNYQNATDRADRAATTQNLRSIHNALLSYRVDYGTFPLADCVADRVPQPDTTEWGCGPAANGYWCGVPYSLVTLDYIAEASLYDPAFQRAYPHTIDAYPSCRQTSFSGSGVPQWRFLRYAYNSSAADTGGHSGGESNINEEWADDIWMVRSLHINPGDFMPDRAVRFPYRFQPVDGEPGVGWAGEFELTTTGTVRERLVHPYRIQP